jgi:glycosyltransferase involved in cell wall biosynthesis
MAIDLARNRNITGPRIAPIAADEARPFLSVMIPVYNSAESMKETLRSVLCQDLGPKDMEIAVVDNCSTDDDPETVVRNIGKGRVTFHRQPRNVGAIENFNACIRRAHGEWVHILHADDTVRPGIYSRVRKAIEDHPYVGAVACRHIYMDEDGTWLHLADAESRTPRVLGDAFVERQLVATRIHFAGLIVRRSSYEELGGFRAEFRHCTDWDMWNRLVLSKPIFYDPELLACNRLHPESGTSHMMRTGENGVDERFCIRASTGHLPRKQAKRLCRDAMSAAAVRALRRMREHWVKGDADTAWRQLREAFRCRAAVGIVGLVYLLTSRGSPRRVAHLIFRTPPTFVGLKNRVRNGIARAIGSAVQWR